MLAMVVVVVAIRRGSNVISDHQSHTRISIKEVTSIRASISSSCKAFHIILVTRVTIESP